MSQIYFPRALPAANEEPASKSLPSINIYKALFFLFTQSQPAYTRSMTIPDCQTVVFCDTAAKCQSAATALGACPVSVLDCEGHNLGAAGGTLSVIVLRATTADARTYLIDVPHLSPTSLQPIADLLHAPAIRKVVFDGRMDFSALRHHALRAELRNVLDLQLIVVMSRFARGETCATQRRRLRSFLKTDELHTRPRLYAQVHRLGSLDGCIAEHAVVPRNTGTPIKTKGESRSGPPSSYS